MKTPTELTDQFRSRGLKVTPQRQAVFRILHDNRTHPTAEAVHAEITRDLPTVSLRTVYQTLNDLTAMGELGQIDVGTRSARFDPNLEPHHHLVCDACGLLTDLEVTFPEVAVPEGIAVDFEITRTEIVFRGRCASCLDADHPRPTITPTNPNTPDTDIKEAHPRHD